HSLAEWRERIWRQGLKDRQRWDAVRQVVQWDWLARVTLLEAYSKGDVNDAQLAEFSPALFEGTARLADPERDPGGTRDLVACLVVVGTPPLLCVLWALLTRGGVTFRLAGLSLRRGSGGRAGRLQCAWRALVFWAPVVALLGLSVWVQTQFPARAL